MSEENKSVEPLFTMREMIEAGVHFGHKTARWNPRVAPYIYGISDGIHIIDLRKTAVLLANAADAVYKVVSSGGRVLFVGRKIQAAPIVEAYAKRCGQYFVTHRWLGGMMTNLGAVSSSIKKLEWYEKTMNNAETSYTKKELAKMDKERNKLQMTLGGIRNMGGLPGIMFVLDTNGEHIAIKEACKLNIPVVGIIDTNSSIEGVAYHVPGNDDSARAVEFYCRVISDAVLRGIRYDLKKSGATKVDAAVKNVVMGGVMEEDDDQKGGDIL